MRTFILIASAATFAALAVQPAAADGIDARQYNQQRRIEQGVRSGQLTGHEASRLRTEQARIAGLEHAAKRDGYVSPAERARISAAQDRASRHIFQEKHDREARGRGIWNRWSAWGHKRNHDRRHYN